MNPRDLNRAVARATGETVREITHRGFVLLTCGPVEHETQESDKGGGESDRFGNPPVQIHEPAFVL